MPFIHNFHYISFCGLKQPLWLIRIYRTIKMKTKTLHRAGFITGNAIRQMLVSVFNMAIPFIVIHYSSKETWGAFVSPLLFTLLVLQFINWGNKEYLLRDLSLQPNKIASLYTTNLGTRLPLVFIFGIIALFVFPLHFGIWIFLWILGRFLNHSAEVLVIYDKAFQQSVAIEGFSFLLFCGAVLLLKNHIDIFVLLVLYSVYQLIKGLAYGALFLNYIHFKNIQMDFNYYTKAFPFLLLSLLGFLASKVDVYIVEHFGNTIATSEYQIINSLLVFVMSVSAFVYAPFTKNIYRLNSEIADKTKQWLLLTGIVIVTLALLLIYCILEFYLLVRVPNVFYTIAFLYVIPSFIYGIEIVNLFRMKKEKKVVQLLFIGALTNAALSALLLNLGYGITGALTGSAIAQWLVLVLIKMKTFEK